MKPVDILMKTLCCLYIACCCIAGPAHGGEIELTGKGRTEKRTLGIFREAGGWRFRVFAPRADKVLLGLYHRENLRGPFGQPDELENMSRENGGTWTFFVGRDIEGFGAHYFVSGPGPDFDEKRPVVDPYALALVNHRGPAVICSPPVPATAGDFIIPAREDLVICEIHLRDFTSHPSSGVPADARGSYLGLASCPMLEHLVDMGFNAVELMPVFEFDDDPPGEYHWGYMPSSFFAPEASYASDPAGAQVDEFRRLVDRLHELGLAVILDVVFNHTGSPHHLAGLDRQYYYRRDSKGAYTNVSGCGNDVRTEAPMARRLIVDAVEYWLKYYHVDGFRFDLAQMIDPETLRRIAQVARRARPGCILIAEPWSFAGNNKSELGSSPDWSCWNDDFRNAVKDFAMGRRAAAAMPAVLSGSTSLWAASPLNSVNYVESHDDYTLVDHLSGRPDHDGSHPSTVEIRMNRMCSLMLMTSPGIPMLAQGQELFRSKRGCHNSYDKGDAVNAVDWSRLTACRANVEYVKSLIRLRRSVNGRAFRQPEALPGDVFPSSFPLEMDNERAVALMIGENPEYMLLLNGSHEKRATFDLPDGKWAQIADLGVVFLDPKKAPLLKERLMLRPVDGRLLQRVQ